MGKVSKIHNAKASPVFAPELSSFRLLIDEPSFLVAWIWVEIHLLFLLHFFLPCHLLLGFHLHPLTYPPTPWFLRQALTQALGNFVASFSCSTYHSEPHESLMTKVEVKKLRRTIWRCTNATFVPRNEVTELCVFVRSPFRWWITYSRSKKWQFSTSV